MGRRWACGMAVPRQTVAFPGAGAGRPGRTSPGWASPLDRQRKPRPSPPDARYDRVRQQSSRAVADPLSVPSPEPLARPTGCTA